MINDKWNDDERSNFDRLSHPSGGATMESVVGLAYTAVMEMYHARVAMEKARAREDAMCQAIGQIANGMNRLAEAMGPYVRMEDLSDRYDREIYGRLFRNAGELDAKDEVLKKCHDWLGTLIRDGKPCDRCSECMGASELADKVYDAIHLGEKEAEKA